MVITPLECAKLSGLNDAMPFALVDAKIFASVKSTARVLALSDALDAAEADIPLPPVISSNVASWNTSTEELDAPIGLAKILN